MKKLLTMIFTMAVMPMLWAQNDIPLCHTPATEKFALFASNKDFNNEHPRPRVYHHISKAGGAMIQFKCPDGSEANAYLIRAATNTNNWIFVFQEWWGLNDNVKRQSEDIFNAVGKVNILALDMYDGKVATDGETAGQYMQAFRQERGDMIVKGALEYVGEEASIGTVGWCFGGGLSLQAALLAGDQTVACVMYYGMPVEDVSRLKQLHSDVLFIWASQDQWINQEVKDQFAKNMAAAGKTLTVESYDANHGFANPSNPLGAFNESAYKDAEEKMTAYFKTRFKN